MKFSLKITAFILYFGLFFFWLRFPFPYLLFLIGGAIGFFFIYIDRFVQLVVEQQLKARRITSSQITHFADQALREDRIKPVLHSLYFILVFILLALYVITSTGSFLGTGVVAGIALYYVSDLWTRYSDHDYIKKNYLSEVKKEFSKTEIRYFLYVVLGLFFLMTLLILN